MTTLLIYVNGHKVCPECLHNDFTVDLHHAETYCNTCGLIVKDSTIRPLKSNTYIINRLQELQTIAPDMEIHD